MRGDQKSWIRLAAMSGFVAVAAGAFAAHGVTDPTAKDLLRTGAQYQMVHALGVLAWAGLFGLPAARNPWVPRLFLAGSVLFSGSLYALALGAPRLTGAVDGRPPRRPPG